MVMDAEPAALVTGGSRGIGAAIVKRLAARGLPGVQRQRVQQALRGGGLGGAAPARHQAFPSCASSSFGSSSNRPFSAAKRSGSEVGFPSSSRTWA